MFGVGAALPPDERSPRPCETEDEIPLWLAPSINMAG
jgi:hypothetical protein